MRQQTERAKLGLESKRLSLIKNSKLSSVSWSELSCGNDNLPDRAAMYIREKKGRQ